jgi:hypothetical protein
VFALWHPPLEESAPLGEVGAGYLSGRIRKFPLINLNQANPIGHHRTHLDIGS